MLAFLLLMLCASPYAVCQLAFFPKSSLSADSPPPNLEEVKRHRYALQIPCPYGCRAPLVAEVKMQPSRKVINSYVVKTISPPYANAAAPSYTGAISQRPLVSPAPSSLAPNIKSLLTLLFVVVLLSCRFPILHQLLMGRQLKYLHHEHVSRYL